MNPAEDCLQHLRNKKWIELNKVLSDNKSAEHLSDSPTFSVFENVFIDEIKRHEDETNEDLFIVATSIFQRHYYKNSRFRLSEDAEVRLAKYLFDRQPHEIYAKILVDDPSAKAYLEKCNNKRQNEIDNIRLSSNLNIRVGEHGNLKFDKDIFNGSLQEKELFLAAQKVLPESILLPNTALSTVINSKVCKFLTSKTTDFFYKSTLDLCVVNPENYMPEIFIELDSSWHDRPDQIERDKMKDEIFQKAALKLDRLRKRQNKDMIEIFQLFIQKNPQANKA